jgi:hypothetical protein
MNRFLGMISVPVYADPRKSGKLRLVVDCSAGDFSTNSRVTRDDVHNHLDTVQLLAHNLLHLRRSIEPWSVSLFNADISQGYRRFTLHSLWQMRHVITMAGAPRIDIAIYFGGRASALICFNIVDSLVSTRVMSPFPLNESTCSLFGMT